MRCGRAAPGWRWSPASAEPIRRACYDTLERAEATGAELVLIDTAGRLHTSADLMRELEKVVNVVRKRSKLPVYTVLVIDATTGQNGLQQAREFNRALDLDALIVTKLDGTAKGGIALAVSHELGLPIVKIGVGEGIDDLRDFDAREFASALVGTFDERFDADEDGLRGENAKEAAVTAGERRRDVLEGAPTCAAEAEEAVEGSAEETVEDATVEALAEVEDGEAPVVDAQGDAGRGLRRCRGGGGSRARQCRSAGSRLGPPHPRHPRPGNRGGYLRRS